MRWQRARVVTDDHDLPVGTLVWTLGPARRLTMPRGTPDGPLLTAVGYLTSDRDASDGTHWWMLQQSLELLPEFSDAEDPDAEVRQ